MDRALGTKVNRNSLGVVDDPVEWWVALPDIGWLQRSTKVCPSPRSSNHNLRPVWLLDQMEPLLVRLNLALWIVAWLRFHAQNLPIGCVSDSDHLLSAWHDVLKLGLQLHMSLHVLLLLRLLLLMDLHVL